MFSTLPVPSRITHEDMIGCNPYTYQAKPFHKSQMGHTLTMVFQVCLIPSPLQTSCLEELFIGTLSLPVKAVLHATVIIFLLWFRELEPSMLLTTVRRISYFPCSTDPHVQYGHKADPYPFMFSDADPLFISHVSRSGSLFDLAWSFLVPFSLEILTPSSRRFLTWLTPLAFRSASKP